MAGTTLSLNLSPVELTLVAAALNDKVKWLDDSIARLREQADEADGWRLLYDAEEANRIMRLHYAGIVRRVEQLLDVPFVDDETARLALDLGRVVVPR